MYEASENINELIESNCMDLLLTQKIDLYLELIYTQAKKSGSSLEIIDNIILPKLKIIEKYCIIPDETHKLWIHTHLNSPNQNIKYTTLKMYQELQIPYKYTDDLVDTVLKILKKEKLEEQKTLAIGILERPIIYQRISKRKTKKIIKILQSIKQNETYDTLKAKANKIMCDPPW